VLLAIFTTEYSWVVLGVLILMAGAASWISLRTVPDQRSKLLGRAFASVGLAGGLTLAIVTQLVLELDPWYSPRFLIPLGGMIFSSCMNTVSLAAERFAAEQTDGKPIDQARATAIRTALIPITNTLFAVGLVSFPGMMTGQVLSGESPLVAARYQIMVMCMTFGASGLAAAMYLWLSCRMGADAESSV
jgi:putative ABC transport system permease protein